VNFSRRIKRLTKQRAMHKEQEPEEEIVADNLLEQVVDFTNSIVFKDSVQAFVNANVHYFIRTSESKDIDSHEIPHEFYIVFQEYKKLIDSLFDKFANSYKFPIAAVYDCFRDAADGKFTPLFEENEYMWFVDKVMSWMDFDEFMKLMYEAASSVGSSSSRVSPASDSKEGEHASNKHSRIAEDKK